MLLVGIACARIISTYNALSLTADEPTHLACGMEYVAEHVYTLETQLPPLSRALQSIGPYLAGARPTGLPVMREEGLSIIAHSGSFNRTVFLMRLGNLPFFLIGCLVVCWWSWHTFGKPIAVLATGLFTLLPTNLADAGIATTDMALGVNVGAAFFATIYWAEKPTWRRALLLGLCAALAFLSKATAVGYVPITVCLAFACYLAVSRPNSRELLNLARQRIATFILAAFTTAFVMWAAYWFSFGILPGTTISLPAPEYFHGVFEALAHDKSGHGAYLFGEFRRTGWWYYFPVVLALKTPIAFLILLGFGIFVSIRQRAQLVYLFPLAFSVGILAPAMFGRIDIGIRHIEPIYVGLSILAALGLVQVLRWAHTGINSALTAGVLVLWMVVSVAFYHPDYLAYFNEFAGKHPENILVDSNYDWGQDLKFLAKRLRELGATQVSLASLDGVMRSDYLQAWYGLPTVRMVNDAIPSLGWNVISPSFDKSFRFQLNDRPTVANPWYDQIAPTERVGPLRLYYITPEERAHFIH
ncbi:MAG: phospholipid carrier-dependent glycosyltransferase [Candidatus Korobacteraceae bacterium]